MIGELEPIHERDALRNDLGDGPTGFTGTACTTCREPGWPKELGVRYVRTGLSWSDQERPGALEWFDRQMWAREDFRSDADLLLHFGSRRHPLSLCQSAAAS